MSQQKKDKISEMKKAVALKYDPEENNAPQVIAKGNHETASEIIKRAKENNIPIYQDESLIKDLVKLDLEKEIPEGL
jgi:flagellar biosynthesis protein